MKTILPAAPAGRVPRRHRKHRSRKIPRWLTNSKEVEAVARQRCLLVLSVLSGEQPVSDAIAQARISRPTYYKLEMRALQGMLVALNPLESGSPQQSVAKERIAHLEALVKRLEQQKRRVQRLWLLSCKSARMPVKIARRGRPPKTVPSPATQGAAPHSRARLVKQETNPTTAPGGCSP